MFSPRYSSNPTRGYIAGLINTAFELYFSA